MSHHSHAGGILAHFYHGALAGLEDVFVFPAGNPALLDHAGAIHMEHLG